MAAFAKRSLGQNFLVDPNIIGKIVTAINPQPEEKIIEIGPGRGAITELLGQSGARIIAMEKDSHLAENLKRSFSENENLTIYECDALNHSWSEFLPADKIVGNLPYNIASQLMLKLFDHHADVPQAVFMVQKEFAQRLTALPETKAYGIMSLYARLYAEVKILFFIPPTVFQPRPNVDSALIQLKLKKQIDIDPARRLFFHSLIRLAFNQRRKTLRNSLRRWYHPDLAKSFCWDKRAEALSLSDFLRLFYLLEEKIISDAELTAGELPEKAKL
jgi:16S rRNA (adenine1518-N6/adenine1519-N6)-dimethyltransferase